MPTLVREASVATTLFYIFSLINHVHLLLPAKNANLLFK